MGLLASYFKATTPALNWMDERYWHSLGVESAAGVRVSPDSARRASAVYCCVNIRGESIASSPLIVYRRFPNGDKERAPQHPLYKVLHDRPNQWQTSFEWREMMQRHLDLRGNAYSHILPGPNGPVDQLVPLHPDRVTPIRYTDGSIAYKVRDLTGHTDTLPAQEICHLRGWSEDGVRGVSPISAQCDTIGMALAAQDYAARFLANDATPSVVLKHPGELGEEAYNRLRNSWQEQQSGANRHKAALLEENMGIEKIGMTNKDAQLLEAQAAGDHKIAAIYRIPAHMLNLLDRATHSNIEHQGLEFRIGTMLPISARWEACLSRDLFFPLFDDPTGEYFAEYLLDGVSRGDLASRYTAYSIGRNWGWLSANDVRRLENMNSIGPEGDEYLRPLNMTLEGSPIPEPTKPGDKPDPQDGAEGSTDADESEQDGNAVAQRNRLMVLAQEAAGRMARKESAAVKRLVAKNKNGPNSFGADIADFYRSHALVISQALRITEDAARRFCDVNQSNLQNAGFSGSGSNWSLVESAIAMNEGRARNLAQLAMEVV